MKRILFSGICLILAHSIHAQVGINTTQPATTLEIVAKSPASTVEGIIIPKLTGDEIFNMPILPGTNESNLVYATSAAAIANQTGVGINLTGRGFFYWDGTVWVSIVNNTTIINNILALVKPMNFSYTDYNDYPAGGTAFISPVATQLRLLNPKYGNPGSIADDIIENNPLQVVMWDNDTCAIKVPPQLLGYAININISLKYARAASNSNTIRIAAYTGNAVTDGTGLYVSGGTKLKDVFFKENPSSALFDYVTDGLLLMPVIVTQEIVDYGIQIYLGGSDNSVHYYYEPKITVDYGVVNTTL